MTLSTSKAPTSRNEDVPGRALHLALLSLERKEDEDGKEDSTNDKHVDGDGVDAEDEDGDGVEDEVGDGDGGPAFFSWLPLMLVRPLCKDAPLCLRDLSVFPVRGTLRVAVK